MSGKILIVEDQWIEANDLQVILEREGFEVTGIAKSVELALSLLQDDRPDMVLLDIFLKGEQTGIDLARILAGRRIPFIYLTANSDTQTLEAAKATHPYGFLVKPYRDKDILVALEIAGYRYKSQQELFSRQEKWLSNMLTTIRDSSDELDEKINQLARAFNPFLPFCYMMIDLNINQENMAGTWLLTRSGYDEFKSMEGWDILEAVTSSWKNYAKFRKGNLELSRVSKDILDVANVTESTRSFSEKLESAFNIRSSLYIPLSSGGGQSASLYFFCQEPGKYEPGQMEILHTVTGELVELVADLIRAEERKRTISGKAANGTVKKAGLPEITGIIGKSARLMDVLGLVRQVAPVDTTVLISGETGVGKEGLANAIHQLSDRKGGPFVKINCAAIPPGLIEAELFGSERGSYTGATERRIGKFEQAQGGTIFLDEVGEIPLDTQSKLLRVLQEKELERIGGRNTIKIDVRIIAATNRNLYAEVGAGRFRIDLYYRLNVFPILVPPLRERKDDIPLLANHFLQEAAILRDSKPKKISTGAFAQLSNYKWPGNVRELQNLLEREILVSESSVIDHFELPEEELVVRQPQRLTAEDQAANEVERINAALRRTNGKISGSGGAAVLLGFTPAVLTAKMRKLGIVWNYDFQ
jgi:DNA-binding NtrC family response regulator